MDKNHIAWKWYITKAEFWHVVSCAIGRLIRITYKCKLFGDGKYLCERYRAAGRKFLKAITKANYYGDLIHEASLEKMKRK